MANSKAVFKAFVESITLDEDPEEKKSIAYIVFEKYLNFSKTDIVANKVINKFDVKYKHLKKIAERINNHEPIQYIINEAEFFGRTFFVNNDVLIPRPETEELVALASEHLKKSKAKKLRVLDIGTGSGCIAVTLKLEFPSAQVIATEVSESALFVAAENALRYDVKITWLHHNILKQNLPFEKLDVVVSNPPYVTESEKAGMRLNVLYHEPSLALFVPSRNALMFYEAIAKKTYPILRKDGRLFLEINANLGAETEALLQGLGYKTKLLQDLQGKSRFVVARKLKNT